MKYPQSFIEEIRQRVRLSEVIGRAVPLRRAGREFHALCPFHKEKSPSFTVNDEKGFFHCFGCGAHGDVIGFTMDYEHLRYPEAIEKLAGAAGLSIPKPTHAESERTRQAESLYEVMAAVVEWLETQLSGTREGEIARDYLNSRALKAETVAQFRLGYAPENRDALKIAMAARGINERQLVETGMLIAVEGRAPYSRFRRRLMFPIRDRKGRVIAFGGRVLPGEPNADAPKYLNSPETPLFHKGRQLYNLDRARKVAMDVGALILAEGYMDVIALAQAGVAHAVAPLGTAITPEQLQLCWQMVDVPTLCLDGDNAGQRAMSRALELALPLLVPGKTLNMAVMPRGEDPDSLLRSGGQAAFAEVLNAAQPLASILWRGAQPAANATPEARAANEQALMQKIGQIKHPTVQHYYKEYMRERLREAQQAAYSAARAPRGKGGKGGYVAKPLHDTTANHALPPLPPITRNTDERMRAPATNLLALVLVCPALLQDAGAEEFWLHAPMPLGWQQRLHHAITEQHIDDTDLSSERLQEALREEIPAEEIAHLTRALEALGLDLSADEVIRHGNAQRLWAEVVNDVGYARLLAECAEAETALAHDMTQENFDRLMQLKAQLEALGRERSRFYREDPLG